MTLPTFNESHLGQGNPHQTLNTNTILHQQNMSLAQISMLNNTLPRRSSLLATTINPGPSTTTATTVAAAHGSPNPSHLLTNPRRLASMAVISRSPLSDSINRATSRLPQASQLLSSTTAAIATATTPFSCSTLTLGNGPATGISQFPTTGLIDRMGGTNGSFMATLNADCAAHSNSIPDPLSPDYCVEYIWSESTYNPLSK